MKKYAVRIAFFCWPLCCVPIICGSKRSEHNDVNNENEFPNSDHDATSDLKNEFKKSILEEHNYIRGIVQPPAGNMMFMEWDDNLERFSQLWVDNCLFRRGTPSGVEYVPGTYGQNMYVGSDPTGYKAMWMWYKENKYYNITGRFCHRDQRCVNYMQLAWSSSSRLGCAVKMCGNQYLINCYYHEPADRLDNMYSIGAPCSQCREEDHAVCWNNLCMSREQCERHPELCEQATCSLKCHNCGRLDTSTCNCDCPDGWDTRDCSRPCRNLHETCGQRPGIADRHQCVMYKYPIAEIYCRKMCGKCKSVTSGSSNICCGGKSCKNGYILNTHSCQCEVLCPGPLCGG